MTDTAERRPVAVSDIAEMLGVSVNTVNQWRKRAASAKRVEPFPPAAGQVANIDYWWDTDVRAWASRTGRLKGRGHLTRVSQTPQEGAEIPDNTDAG